VATEKYEKTKKIKHSIVRKEAQKKAVPVPACRRSPPGVKKLLFSRQPLN
jgi:hypothetical protein